MGIWQTIEYHYHPIAHPPVGCTAVRPFTAMFLTDRLGFTIAVASQGALLCTLATVVYSFDRLHCLTFLGTLIDVAVRSIL
jgi:hypothetical protein